MSADISTRDTPSMIRLKAYAKKPTKPTEYSSIEAQDEPSSHHHLLDIEGPGRGVGWKVLCTITAHQDISNKDIHCTPPVSFNPRRSLDSLVPEIVVDPKID